MTSTDSTILVPGDELDIDALEISSSKLALGPGLYRQDGDVVKAYKAGLLKHEGKVAWIDNKQKRVCTNVSSFKYNVTATVCYIPQFSDLL